MTDTLTNSKRQDVYSTQVYSSNVLINLVVIWYKIRIALHSLGHQMQQPACNHWHRVLADYSKILVWLKKLLFNQWKRIQAPLTVRKHKACKGVLEQDTDISECLCWMKNLKISHYDWTFGCICTFFIIFFYNMMPTTVKVRQPVHFCIEFLDVNCECSYSAESLNINTTLLRYWSVTVN